MNPAEELEVLRTRGAGILSDAMNRPVEGTYGGDERARQAAIGNNFISIQRAWNRLHEDYAAFMRKQVEAAKPTSTPVKK